MRFYYLSLPQPKYEKPASILLNTQLTSRRNYLQQFVFCTWKLLNWQKSSAAGTCTTLSPLTTRKKTQFHLYHPFSCSSPLSFTLKFWFYKQAPTVRTTFSPSQIRLVQEKIIIVLFSVPCSPFNELKFLIPSLTSKQNSFYTVDFSTIQDRVCVTYEPCKWPKSPTVVWEVRVLNPVGN